MMLPSLENHMRKTWPSVWQSFRVKLRCNQPLTTKRENLSPAESNVLVTPPLAMSCRHYFFLVNQVKVIALLGLSPIEKNLAISSKHLTWTRTRDQFY